MTDSIALLPCPFCGCVPDAMLSFDSDQGTKWGRVICPECASWGPEVRTDYKPLEHWRARAAAEWNTRAALSPAGSGLTANSEPVAWQYRDGGPQWFDCSEHAASLLVNDGRFVVRAIYTTPPPSVDVDVMRKLRELVHEWESSGCVATCWNCADELRAALNAAGANG